MMVRQMIDVTLVTGVSRGLGFNYGLHVLQRGERLVTVSRRIADDHWIRGKHKGEVHAIECDLGDEKLSEVLKQTLDAGEMRIRRVLHAAGGGLGMRNPLVTRGEIDQVLQANLLGGIEINRVVVPHMISHGGGRIVHVGSTAGTHAVGSVAYNTAKAALTAYVRSLGRELVADRVLVCGINPGAFVATRNAMVRLKESKPEVFDKFVVDRLPLGRMSQVTELFGILDFLLYGDADMMAGSMVAIDAGESLAY